jgi:hypothetical protein
MHGRTWADMADMRADEGYFFKHCQVCVCFRETKRRTDCMYFVAIHSLIYNSNGTLLSSFPSTPVKSVG